MSRANRGPAALKKTNACRALDALGIAYELEAYVST
jgi:hypothetical protein